MANFYYQGIWHPVNTKEEIITVIRDCFSSDLAKCLEDNPFDPRDLDQLELERDGLRADLLEAEERAEMAERDLDRLKPELLPGLGSHTPAHRLRASLPAEVLEYQDKGEPPYRKYACPVCRSAGIHIGLVPPEKGRYSSCPCCGVRLEWPDPEEEGIPLF